MKSNNIPELTEAFKEYSSKVESQNINMHNAYCCLCIALFFITCAFVTYQFGNDSLSVNSFCFLSVVFSIATGKYLNRYDDENK